MFFSKRTKLIRRILIVEDEPLLAFENEHALKQAGYEVVATVDRFRDADAIILNHGAVDLVITDIRLTGTRSGIELARHARELGIAVLFATANWPDETRMGGISLGCLSKPYAPRSLVRSIAICERLVAGLPAGRLPPGLKLFSRN